MNEESNPEFVGDQPDISKVFERHTELSTKRRLVFVDDYGYSVIYNRGRQARYRILTRASRGRLLKVCEKYGDPVYHSQWGFDDKIECRPDPLTEDREKQIVGELGFGQYQ